MLGSERIVSSVPSSLYVSSVQLDGMDGKSISNDVETSCRQSPPDLKST